MNSQFSCRSTDENRPATPSSTANLIEKCTSYNYSQDGDYRLESLGIRI
jgi:hypothetical protein